MDISHIKNEAAQGDRETNFHVLSGAGYEGLRGIGLLWVLESLPYRHRDEPAPYVITAQGADDMPTLLRRWWILFDLGPPATSDETLQNQFHQVLRRHGYPVLVCTDAHHLRPETLALFRHLAAAGSMVIAQGDVVSINLQMRQYPSFFQRALYCIANVTHIRKEPREEHHAGR
jgi:hypothetical protein